MLYKYLDMYDVMLSSQLALVLNLCKVNVNRTDVAYAECNLLHLLVQDNRYDVIAIILLCIVIGHLLFCCIS